MQTTAEEQGIMETGLAHCGTLWRSRAPWKLLNTAAAVNKRSNRKGPGPKVPSKVTTSVTTSPIFLRTTTCQQLTQILNLIMDYIID